MLAKAAKRVALEVLGWVLVVGGIAALVLPGPGLLAIFAGLAVLSQQYEWAERRLEPVKERAHQAAADGVRTWPRIFASVLGASGVVACGVLWLTQPPAPEWWTLREEWWLLGGRWTGATLIISGIIAFALIVYSLRHFRGSDLAAPADRTAD